MISFKNKNILITGASGGIGQELVKKFVSLDANVLGSGTKAEKLDEISASWNSKKLDENPAPKNWMNFGVQRIG